MRPRNLQKEEAIRTVALQIIAEEGLENLTMQKLAQAAGISARTIYLKYADKEDLLIRLFLDEVLDGYEKATLQDFDPAMDFAAGMHKLWTNVFTYLKERRPAFALLRYGQSSPLLNKAYQERNIKQGSHFVPIHHFLRRHAAKGTIRKFPIDVYRALLFAPLLELVAEYFDHRERPKQIITSKTLESCCQAVTAGLLLKSALHE